MNPRLGRVPDEPSLDAMAVGSSTAPPSGSSRVCALIIVSADQARPEQCLTAIARQSRPPDETLVVCPGRARVSAAGSPRTILVQSTENRFDAAVRAGLTTSCDWLWVVDAEVLPAPRALEQFLSAAPGAGSLPPPVLLAGKVLQPNGQLDFSRAPWPRHSHKHEGLLAVEAGLISIRAARWGSLLVSAHAIHRSHAHGERGATSDGGIGWTARLLRSEFGYLVPRSEAVTAADARREGRARTRLSDFRSLSGGAWTREEKLQAGFFLFLDMFDAWRQAGSEQDHRGGRNPS